MELPLGAFQQSITALHTTLHLYSQVRVNECYELVVTTLMGLYRYRTGDVVKIVDFINQCPQYRFQYRCELRSDVTLFGYS